MARFFALVAIAAWVRHADANGVAGLRENIALGAEYGFWTDHPNVGIAEHEILHNLGADHFPGDSWLKYICGVHHEHWWGTHYHAFWSVMNYCWLQIRSNHIDQTSKDVINGYI